MKIRNDQLQALQQQQSEVRKTPKEGGSFDALLAENLSAVQGLEETAVPAPLQSGPLAPLASTLGILEGGEEATEDAEGIALGSVALSIEGLLGQMDAYASSLSSHGSDDLRGAYALLQDMDRGVKALRRAVPGLGSRDAGLEAMVNELEVLTATESVKFNRGDYL